MGDFYETFGEDAEITSKTLNIALTSRDKKDDPTPLAGFPHHALNQYLPKLVKAGHNVAVADQVEDPKTAKGIVRREITRIVTPGTLVEDAEDGHHQFSYIASLYKHKSNYGLALCDVSTGSLAITETTEFLELKDEIGRTNPAEILIPPKQDFSAFSTYPIQVQEEHDYSYDNAKLILCDQLKVRNLASFGITPHRTAISAASAIIAYLQETQKDDLAHISSISYYDLHGHMILDNATIRNLELIASAGEFGRHHSLRHILDKCQTGMGSRTVYSWILHPLLNQKEIEKRLESVDYFFQNPDELSHTIDLLKQVHDLERISGRMGMNRCNARDLVNLADSIEHALTVLEALSDVKALSGEFKRIFKLKPELLNTVETVRKGISNSPPLTITEGGIIKSGYNKSVDKIRDETSDSKSWIENLEKEERKRTGITSLKVRMNKVFGYYIEVTNTHKDKVPDDYVRKQTLVNSERYITPELKEKEDIVFNAQERPADLEYECFQKIREEILKNIDAIQAAAAVIGTIDAYCSFAHVARMNNYSRPTVYPLGEKKGLIEIKSSRHPTVELSIDDEFIHNDIEMNNEQKRLHILTGPNMSGKSTYIRQIALIVLMAQIGSFIPAVSGKISIVDRIFTRVGASDDLSGGRSTFMVEMDEAANIVNNATQHSLIILDEVGRGTSTYDGVSIAWAMAEHIHNSIGARCLFATHYHELLKLKTELNGAQNYNVAVLEEEGRVLFLHKIEKGGTDRSYGIYVAEMAGLPKSMIDRANEILEGFEQENMFGHLNETPEVADIFTKALDHYSAHVFYNQYIDRLEKQNKWVKLSLTDKESLSDREKINAIYLHLFGEVKLFEKTPLFPLSGKPLAQIGAIEKLDQWLEEENQNCRRVCKTLRYDLRIDKRPLSGHSRVYYVNECGEALRRAGRSISLRRSGLTLLPIEFESVSLLQKLYLSENQLTSLPKGIGRCTALKELYISHNQLSALPTEIGRCAALQVLDLKHNQLTTLPAGIGGCTALKWLSLRHNQLTTYLKSID